MNSLIFYILKVISYEVVIVPDESFGKIKLRLI